MAESKTAEVNYISPIMPDSSSTALQKLATYRAHNTRASQEIFESGVELLKSNATRKLGDEGQFQTDSWKVDLQLETHYRLGFSRTAGPGVNRCWSLGYSRCY